MKRLLIFLLPLALGLAACAPAATPAQLPAPATEPAATDLPPTSAAIPTVEAAGDLVRVDEQGMVAVQVTPLNLDPAAESLDFEIAMNTHSVDLSMDLSTLSTLTTDTGLSVQPNKWDAPSGGHHVSGMLSFPSTQDGKAILEGAGKLTLIILNVDAPSRVFEWELK